MSEDQIERTVERKMDALDRMFMRGAINEQDYERSVRSLDAWANAAYSQAKREG